MANATFMQPFFFLRPSELACRMLVEANLEEASFRLLRLLFRKLTFFSHEEMKLLSFVSGYGKARSRAFRN